MCTAVTNIDRRKALILLEKYGVLRKQNRWLMCKLAAASGGEIDEERAEAE
jgi:hypothetical protein